MTILWSNAPQSSFCKFFACLLEHSSIQFNLMVLGGTQDVIGAPKCTGCWKNYQMMAIWIITTVELI